MLRQRRFKRLGPVLYPTLSPTFEVPWIKRLLSSVPVMMRECEAFIQAYERKEIKASDHYELINLAPNYGTNLKQHDHAESKRLRGTIEATANLRGPENVMVSKLVRLNGQKGGTGVQLHVDIYPNVVNVLVPIRAPKNNSFLYVKQHGILPFKQGEPIVFNPSFLHAAWNDSESTRYVYNIGISTGSGGAFKRWCAYHYTKRVGSYKIRYYSS